MRLRSQTRSESSCSPDYERSRLVDVPVVHESTLNRLEYVRSRIRDQSESLASSKRLRRLSPLPSQPPLRFAGVQGPLADSNTLLLFDSPVSPLSSRRSSTPSTSAARGRSTTIRASRPPTPVAHVPQRTNSSPAPRTPAASQPRLLTATSDNTAPSTTGPRSAESTILRSPPFSNSPQRDRVVVDGLEFNRRTGLLLSPVAGVGAETRGVSSRIRHMSIINGSNTSANTNTTYPVLLRNCPTYADFYQRINSNLLLETLVSLQLIPNSSECRFCYDQQTGAPVVCNLQRYSKARLDGIVYRCPVCRRRTSVRNNTIFENSKLSLQAIMQILYGFVTDTSIIQLANNLNVAESTIINWYEKLMDVCEHANTKLRHSIGGQGHCVQVDETVMFKRKYNVGQGGPTRWVWGVYDSTSKIGYAKEVPDRSASVLVPLTEEYVMEGSTMVADEWRAYGPLSYKYELFRVCHKYHFRDPFTGETTNHVEAFWHRIKDRIRRVRGSQGEKQHLRLEEAIYKENNGFTQSTPWMTKLSVFCNSICMFLREVTGPRRAAPRETFIPMQMAVSPGQPTEVFPDMHLTAHIRNQ